MEALLTRILGLSDLWSLLIAAVTLVILVPVLASRALSARHDARQHDSVLGIASTTSGHHYVTAIQYVLKDGEIVWRDSSYVGREASRQWQATTLDLKEPLATVRPATTLLTFPGHHALRVG
ncbi:MAG: hypothetical protein WBM00_08320 [Solirubrobacterales bacterium]